MIQIPQDIFDVFETDAQAHKVGCDAGAGLLFRRELAVRRAGGMNRQALGIAHVRQVAEELKVVDKVAPRFQPALDAKAQNRAGAFGQILFRGGIVRMTLEAGIGDPTDPGMLFQELGHGLRVLDVALHAQAERFQRLAGTATS